MRAPACIPLLCLALLSCLSRPDSRRPDTVTGQVRDEDGPVASATVRVQATAIETFTDSRGVFSIPMPPGLARVTISAWKDGYYCAKAEVTPGPSGRPGCARWTVLSLRRYQTGDNPDYEWVPPDGGNSCMSCKPEVTRFWLDNDSHARSAVNPRFLTMYQGTDVHGNRSPPTGTAPSRDYGTVPLPPDPAQPYFGPGYKLDFSDTAGNCACCHIPGAAMDDPFATDPTAVRGADAYGIHCDFCHKIADVILEPSTGLPYPNRPGVLSLDVRRPFPDDPQRYQLFFGPFDDDNVPEEDTYLPLQKQSAFCAACHHGTFWGTVVYDSYGEWLASPWSNPESGKSCQQCHMSPQTVVNGRPLTNVAAGKGGVERDPSTIPAHDFLGASSEALLRNAVSMEVEAQRADGGLAVEIRITNDRTGHHVPTDSPLRHLILVVRATAPDGSDLAQVSGPTVPAWAGAGDPDRGYLAGLPGKAFAKVLQERWTGVSPTGAYWNMTFVESDNRIPAFATDSSRYEFRGGEQGPVRVEARLLFRRAYRELMDQKGWDVPDILMVSRIVEVP